jgi:hypothetical protein
MHAKNQNEEEENNLKLKLFTKLNYVIRKTSVSKLLSVKDQIKNENFSYCTKKKFENVIFIYFILTSVCQ